MGSPRADLDTPWKETLALFLPDALALFWPDIHDEINWQRGYTFLDKELRQIAPDAATGRQLVDALVRVWHKGGGEVWLVLHIEVQGQTDPQLPQRMFSYYYRALDRFGLDREIISMVIYSDGAPDWRPASYSRGRPGNRLSFEFFTAKVLDWRGREDELRATINPFAVIVRAHLAMLATRNEHGGSNRLTHKLSLVRELYVLGYDRKRVVQLFRVIDWLLRLPPAQEEQFWQEVHADEEAKRMPYLTSVERRAIERGREQGLEQGLEQGREQGRGLGLRDGLLRVLAMTFGPKSEVLNTRIAQVTEVALIEELWAVLENGGALEDLARLIDSRVN